MAAIELKSFSCRSDSLRWQSARLKLGKVERRINENDVSQVALVRRASRDQRAPRKIGSLPCSPSLRVPRSASEWEGEDLAKEAWPLFTPCSVMDSVFISPRIGWIGCHRSKERLGP